MWGEVLSKAGLIFSFFLLITSPLYSKTSDNETPYLKGAALSENGNPEAILLVRPLVDQLLEIGSNDDGKPQAIDRISGNIESAVPDERQVYKSKNHYGIGVFAAERALSKSQSNS